MVETFHDAVQIKDDAQARFDLGLLDLATKAQVETLFWEIAEGVVKHFSASKTMPDEIDELKNSLGDQFLCNFSVFQSLLDHWALGQLFPIVPIHRLNEEPSHSATLVDITCDSDGKIAKFIDGEDAIRQTLPLHALNGKPYYLGIFLLGAYQDIMGDLHNLFGRVNEAHIFLDADEESGFYIEETIPRQHHRGGARRCAVQHRHARARDEGTDRPRDQGRRAQAERGDAAAPVLRRGAALNHLPAVLRPRFCF